MAYHLCMWLDGFIDYPWVHTLVEHTLTHHNRGFGTSHRSREGSRVPSGPRREPRAKVRRVSEAIYEYLLVGNPLVAALLGGFQPPSRRKHSLQVLPLCRYVAGQHTTNYPSCSKLGTDSRRTPEPYHSDRRFTQKVEGNINARQNPLITQSIQKYPQLESHPNLFKHPLFILPPS